MAYVSFRNSSFRLPVSLIVDNGTTVSLFSYHGLYFGDFLPEEIKSYNS